MTHSTQPNKKRGFTLAEVMTALFVFGMLMTGLMEFFISTSVTLQSTQTELATAQGKREATQNLKLDAKNSDYLLAYDDLTAMADDEEALDSGSRGNIVLFVTNQVDNNIYDNEAASFDTVVAYYIHTDQASGTNSLQRVEVGHEEQESGESISQMVARVINSGEIKSRNITNGFEANLGGDLFYLFRSDSIVVNASIKEGYGVSEFSKNFNLTLNVSST
ncbi:MAG: type II secretion system protein [Opitutales bacterium]